MRFDHITIIGNGVSGIATFISLIMYSNVRNITFISPNEMGYSEAFSEASKEMICNTSVGSISIVPNNQNDFLLFLISIGESVTVDDFVPRSLVELYIKKRYELFYGVALSKGIVIKHIKDKVQCINYSNSPYLIKTENNKEHLTDAIVVCSGYSNNRIPSMFEKHLKQETFYINPYPLKKVIEKSPRNSNVLIIGSKLSAIETSIHLAKNKHIVTMLSPSGEIPAVRGHTVPLRTSILNKNSFEKINFKDRGLGKKIINEINKSLIKNFKNPVYSQVSREIIPIDRLREELNLALDGKIYWQDIMVEVIDKLNELLLTQDIDVKNKFINQCMPIIDRYMGACSIQSAEILLEKLIDNKIKLRNGVVNKIIKEEKWNVFWQDGSELFDTIILATGREYPNFYINDNDNEVFFNKKEFLKKATITKNYRLFNNKMNSEEHIWFVGISSHSAIPLINAIYPVTLQVQEVGEWFRLNENVT
ncbi:FAD/NAD(P)-binding protein [Xenorhabdus bovienii]|uniref:FAD-dependent urate hydroxylase HpyO/Asp monooxygenase CreE-like FAD/NAD(P)-binding domain-containing protein n=1 Tax=Xenorhabdus bovienii str. feltiae Moldova TaxID=1398200 RepID=A0A077NVX0_XENBV|nr:FAD/NAD(P)-binding domain-containing protein [Xenorhabdus bovienii]CDH03050.1 conserved hypothetical protein [Xenorhabdus bovienii str. feltiae Moldova]